MATDDIQRLVTGSAAAPATFKVPGNGQIRPKTIFATYNGAGAGGAFLPALKIVSDGGETIGIYKCDTQVAAGASADVTWFPRLARTASAAPTSSGLGTMIATTNFGTDVTVPAGTTRTLTWDEIVVDGSGTFTNGGGSGATWSIAKPGQYQVLLCVTPTTNWPAAGSGPVVLEILDPDANLVLRAGAIFDTDGSLESPVLVGMVSTSGGSVPARVRIALKNTTATDFTTQGDATFVTMNRLGDEVDF